SAGTYSYTYSIGGGNCPADDATISVIILDSLMANVADIVCQDNGTADQGDDLFTFTLNPSGNGLGTTYSVSGAVNLSGLTYGSTQVIGPFNISDGPVTIRVQDEDGAGCQSREIIVTPPAACSCLPQICLPIEVIKRD
ncbi:MAG: hypothetical protein AAFO94_23185, partial [Bacteroidota bacterium]